MGSEEGGKVARGGFSRGGVVGGMGVVGVARGAAGVGSVALVVVVAWGVSLAKKSRSISWSLVAERDILSRTMRL